MHEIVWYYSVSQNETSLFFRTDHIKEGLVRFFCLIPYDVITLQVWNQAMSHWMEAINQGMKTTELSSRADIHQALLSQFSLLAESFIGKLPIEN